MYSELLKQFADYPVVTFEDATSWRGPDVAYRIREDYEDERTVIDRLDTLLEQPQCEQLQALIIGAWTKACEGDGPSDIVAALAAAAHKLPHLRHLFMGEMIYEECELSWINQANLTPLLQAFPRLVALRVRGANGLAFAPLRHDGLESLAIECGGLPRSVLHELPLCHFRNLRRLELALGESNYGFDGSIDDLEPILSGESFPKLKFLGLTNSELADEIAGQIVNAPVIEQLETLDLSLGNMSDEGVRSLHALAERPHLKHLNISHHYASEDEIAALTQAVHCEVIATDRQEPDDEWRPILHAE